MATRSEEATVAAWVSLCEYPNMGYFLVVNLLARSPVASPSLPQARSVPQNDRRSARVWAGALGLMALLVASAAAWGAESKAATFARLDALELRLRDARADCTLCLAGKACDRQQLVATWRDVAGEMQRVSESLKQLGVDGVAVTSSEEATLRRVMDSVEALDGCTDAVVADSHDTSGSAR